MSKFSKCIDSGHIIGASRVIFGEEVSKANPATIFIDLCSPLMGKFIPTDAPIFTTPFLLLFISCILCLSTFPQIIAPVIQCVVILMIPVFFRFTLKNHTVHPDVRMGSYVRIGSYDIKRFGAWIPMCIPRPPIQPLKISSIYDGILPLREWDESVRLVERLDNFVSRNTLFWHESSKKGFVLPAAF